MTPLIPGQGSTARPRRRSINWTAAGLLALGLLALGVFAVLGGDVPDLFGDGIVVVRQLLRRFGDFGAFGLLYLEESGVPMPMPGDVFVIYVGHHTTHTVPTLVAAWLGLIVVVVLGATNLYLISRKWGRGLVEGRLRRVLHMTPARLAKAEGWFARWGPLALIFGRHIPGMRVPLTLGAGIFRVSYPVFAVSVAISTAIWAGVFIVVGAAFGGRAAHLLGLHRWAYVVVPVALTVGFALYVAVQLLRSRREDAAAS